MLLFVGRRAIGLALIPVLVAALLAPASTLGDVQIRVDATRDRHAISPYIYGSNSDKIANRTGDRLGGNRWTAYNWENNASNAGSDYYFNNDGFLGGGDTPGGAVLPTLRADADAGRATTLTLPMAGYVSADKPGGGRRGDLTRDPNHLANHFKQVVAQKSIVTDAPFTFNPDTNDDYVYNDEYVNWVENHARTSPQQKIFYNLDNEPALWSHTHREVHPEPTTYDELVRKTIDNSKAIRGVDPDAVIFGGVTYGWTAQRSLQGAPDSDENGDFQAYFLKQLAQAQQQTGQRNIDVLDMHWYPEARGGGVRITENNTSDAVVAARVQAARSLWDPTYVEDSYITRDNLGGHAIQLLPRTRRIVDENNPGVRLAITEYSYGAGDHISGGIAQADALGVFGQQDLFAADWWDLNVGSSYIQVAFNAYLNYDGRGGHFGDTSIAATTDDLDKTAVFASVDSDDPTLMVLVLINRTEADVDADVQLTTEDGLDLSTARAFVLTGGSADLAPADGSALTLSPDALKYTLPAYSVTTLELHLVPSPTAAAPFGVIGLLALGHRPAPRP